MKTILTLGWIAALTLYLAPSARADREILSKSILSEVQKVQGGIDRVRVYVTTKVTVESEANESSQTNVGKGVERKITEKTLTETLTRRTRGKIVAVQNSGLDPYRLFVTFDPACMDERCAYRFVLSNYGHSRRPKTSEQRFSLEGVPSNKDYDSTVVETRGEKLTKCDYVLADVCDYKRGLTVSLAVKLDELREVIHEHRKLPGVE